jgi:hypothetical protein
MSLRAMSVTLAAGIILTGLATQAAAQGGPYQYHSVTPCRVADTRTPAPASPLADQETRTFVVQGVCGIPVGAAAVSINLTALGPTGLGFLTAFPTGITRPVVSSLNFSAGEPALGNGALVPLADQGSFAEDLSIFARVAATGGTVNVVIDVTGYFQ